MVFLYSGDSIYIAERYVAEANNVVDKYGDRLQLRFNNTTNELSVSNTTNTPTIIADADDGTPTDPDQQSPTDPNAPIYLPPSQDPPSDAVLKNTSSQPVDQTVYGNFNLVGGLTCSWVTATSDERLKHNMVEIGDIPLTDLKVYSYTIHGKRRFGIKAQEVDPKEQLSPLLENNGKNLSVDYNGLTALLLERVNRLENKLKEMS